ncbi:hypothetical protein D9M71_366850 [compost metagenome]
MNRSGQLALAGAGLTKNEDIGIGGGNLACSLQHHHHRRAVRVQAVFGFVDFTFQCFQACRQLAHFQLFGRSQAQLVRAAGFDQVVGRTRLDGVDCGIDR